MSEHVTAAESATLKATAQWNGRVTSEVFIARRAEPAAFLVAELIKLGASDDRAKIVGRLPEDLRDEASTLLMDLAAKVAIDRCATPAKSKDDWRAATHPEEPWPEPVAAAEMLDAIVQVIQRYAVLPKHATAMLALWVAHTYVADLFDFTPYVHLGSPVRECGKSTVLELILNLAHDAQLSGGYTASALFRRIASSPKMTMLLDELDTRLRGDGGEAIRGVLNTGFQRLGKVMICVGDNHEPTDFSTFCPKILAGIGHVWDTVASRCIPVRMERATKEELKELKKIRGHLIGRELLDLRRQLARWASDSAEWLKESDPKVPDDLGARQADIWRPMFAIADDAAGEWPKRARDAALALHKRNDETDNALLLLSDVRELLGNADALATASLLEELPKLDDRPWSEYSKQDKPITARGIASLLGRFDLKSGTVRIGSATPKGYSRGKLVPVFNRYLKTPPAPSDLSATSATSLPGNELDAASVANDFWTVADATNVAPSESLSVAEPNSLPHNIVADVADRNGGMGPVRRADVKQDDWLEQLMADESHVDSGEPDR